MENKIRNKIKELAQSKELESDDFEENIDEKRQDIFEFSTLFLKYYNKFVKDFPELEELDRDTLIKLKEHSSEIRKIKTMIKEMVTESASWHYKKELIEYVNLNYDELDSFLDVCLEVYKQSDDGSLDILESFNKKKEENKNAK